MPANYKPFDKEEWLRLEKKADELRLSKQLFGAVRAIWAVRSALWMQ